MSYYNIYLGMRHLYDALLMHEGLEHWLQDALPNTLIAVLYLIAFVMVWRVEAGWRV